MRGGAPLDDVEGNREEGGTHGEAPPYGLTAPAGGAAIAARRGLGFAFAHHINPDDAIRVMRRYRD